MAQVDKLVAHKEYAVGEVVYREAPLLVWGGGQTVDGETGEQLPEAKAWMEVAEAVFPPDGKEATRKLQERLIDSIQFMRAVVAQPVTVQEQIAEMVSADSGEHLDDDVATVATALATKVDEFVGKVDEVTAKRLLAARGYGYEFNNDSSALFKEAARVRHSCAPNVQYRFSQPTADGGVGGLEFVACQSIVAGEDLEYSYLSPMDLCSGTPTRRRLIARRMARDLTCECRRCTSPDLARALKCPEEQCRGHVVRRESKVGGEDKRWECSLGAHAFPDSTLPLEAENNLCTRFLLAYQTDRHNKSLIDALRKEATEVLGTKHWVTARLCEMTAQIYSLLTQMPDPEASVMYQHKAAAWSMKFMMWHMKHVTDCPFAGSMVAMWVSRDLRDLGRERRAVNMYRTYLPFIKNQYGADDEDVQSIERVLADPSILPNDKCEACGKEAVDSGEGMVKLSLCQGCYVVMYCSSECQKGHWPTHKSCCGK